jgi:hypothetical protein
MRDIKIEINEDNKHIYIETLRNMVEIIKSKKESYFYDVFAFRYANDLMRRIDSIRGKKKITLHYADQIIVTISFAFNPDITAKVVMQNVGNQIHNILDDLSKQYIHDLSIRK